MKVAAAALCVVLAGCAARMHSTEPGRSVDLLETYWRPAEIDGKPAVISPGTRERARVHRLQLAGWNLYRKRRQPALWQDGVTRMACLAQAAKVQEAAFTRALDATAPYRIAGNILELRDASEATRMRLEAR